MPSVEDLLLKEVVDKLGYMGWQVDQGADPVKVSSGSKVEGCVSCDDGNKDLVHVPAKQFCLFKRKLK